jgi:hypothetical protein
MTAMADDLSSAFGAAGTLPALRLLIGRLLTVAALDV